MTVEDRTSDLIQNQHSGERTPQAPPWARASVVHLADLDFEAPVAESESADSTELGDLFRAAAGAVGENGELPDTPSARVFNMLAAVMGMYFKPQEANEPFGAMAIFADGRRSAFPTDFRGPPIEVLADMAARSKHPVLRARLARHVLAPRPQERAAGGNGGRGLCRKGKVVHRSEGTGVGDGADRSAIQRQIAQDENIRRHITVSGEIEVARQAIAREHYISEDVFALLLGHSPFVPSDLVMTYSRGFARFFQGDFVSGLYILTPLLENSLRHVLKSQGHDVTKFDDAKLTQEDRTISSLFEQMRPELVSVFGDAIATDIENVFLKKPGPYLRHSLSHGLLHDGDPYSDDAIYAAAG